MRIWSKKVVSVLRHAYLYPQKTLFGVTGDIDNLGVYVARNGRARAEILVDTYNRVIGSVYHTFLNSRPHLFFETCFLPAGEEIFILGLASDAKVAESLFNHLDISEIPRIISESLPFDIGNTNISFGCSVLSIDSLSPNIKDLLSEIDRLDTGMANRLYSEIVEAIRSELAVELDLKKFASLIRSKHDSVLLRNLVYLKTVEYKEETKKLLLSVAERLSQSATTRDQLESVLGDEYGLSDINMLGALKKVSSILSD